MLQAISRGFASIFKFDPSQPRAPAGTGNGGQWVKGSEAAPLEAAHNDPAKVKPEPVKVRTLPTILKEWSQRSLWGKYQEAARHVLGDFNHDTWDMNNDSVAQQQMMGGLHTGSKGQLEAEAKKLLSAIEKSQPLTFPLYRGVHANDAAANLKVGDTFSESLSGWSSKRDWAVAFSHNKFATTSGGYAITDKDVMFVLKGSNMKGLSVSKYAPEGTMFKEVDEWLTSGQYKVTGITPGTVEQHQVKQTDIWGNEQTVTKKLTIPKIVEVERVGPATKETIVKSETEQGFAHVFKFNPNHDPKNGQFTEGGDGAPKDVKLSQLEGVLHDMADNKDAHPNIMDMGVDGEKPFGGKGLDIPREYMPQVPQKRRQEFLDSLHVDVTEKKVDPSKLKPTQNQLDGHKVGKIYKELVKGDGHVAHVPILVSKDGYVIDGHHHWGGYTAYNLLNPHKEINAFVVGMDHKKLLEAAGEFAAEHGIKSKDITKADTSGGLAHVFKFNPNHEPAGSPKGGQFAKANEGGGGAATEHEDVSIGDYAAAHEKEVTASDVLARLDPADAKEIQYALVKAESLPVTKTTYSKDGHYTADRLELHKAIIDKFTSEEAIKHALAKPDEAPNLVVLGGVGGSGKSKFTDGTIKEFDPAKFVTLDSDEIKKELPEYKGWNAAQVNAESSDLVDTIRNVLLARGVNVILDATLKSLNIESTLQQAKASGYNIEGHYMYLPRSEAAFRAMGRYLGKNGKRGRLVPPDVILGMKNGPKNFDYLKKYFSKWSAYDNSGKTVKLIGKGGE